jgi:hypothetical protein
MMWRRCHSNEGAVSAYLLYAVSQSQVGLAIVKPIDSISLGVHLMRACLMGPVPRKCGPHGRVLALHWRIPHACVPHACVPHACVPHGACTSWGVYLMGRVPHGACTSWGCTS